MDVPPTVRDAHYLIEQAKLCMSEAVGAPVAASEIERARGLCRQAVQLMRKSAGQSRDAALRRSFFSKATLCRKCYVPLMEGVSAVWRSRSSKGRRKKLSVMCTLCGTIKRYFLVDDKTGKVFVPPQIRLMRHDESENVGNDEPLITYNKRIVILLKSAVRPGDAELDKSWSESGADEPHLRHFAAVQPPDELFDSVAKVISTVRDPTDCQLRLSSIHLNEITWETDRREMVHLLTRNGVERQTHIFLSTATTLKAIDHLLQQGVLPKRDIWVPPSNAKTKRRKFQQSSTLVKSHTVTRGVEQEQKSTLEAEPAKFRARFVVYVREEARKLRDAVGRHEVFDFGVDGRRGRDILRTIISMYDIDESVEEVLCFDMSDEQKMELSEKEEAVRRRYRCVDTLSFRSPSMPRLTERIDEIIGHLEGNVHLSLLIVRSHDLNVALDALMAVFSSKFESDDCRALRLQIVFGNEQIGKKLQDETCLTDVTTKFREMTKEKSIDLSIAKSVTLRDTAPKLLTAFFRSIFLRL